LKAKRSLTEVIEDICRTKFIASAEIEDSNVSEALGDLSILEHYASAGLCGRKHYLCSRGQTPQGKMLEQLPLYHPLLSP